MADIASESDWLACVEPLDLARCARGRVEPQRFRWLAVEWGRRIRHLLELGNVEGFDAYAAWVAGNGPHPNGLGLPRFWMPLDRPLEDLFWARRCASHLRDNDDPLSASACAGQSASMHKSRENPVRIDATKQHPVRSAKERLAEAQRQKAHRDVANREQKANSDRVRREFCGQFRDVAGNPFRPVTLDAKRLTPDVLALAKAIHAEAAFDRMPVLADGLEEAGCVSAGVLLHCRGDEPHVRGCWVIDLLTGGERLGMPEPKT